MPVKPFDPNKPGDSKSPESKLLEAAPERRAALTTPTFKRLKKHLPKIEISPNVKTAAEKAAFGPPRVYYVTEGDLTLDEDQLLFYAREWDKREAGYLTTLKIKDPTKALQSAQRRLIIASNQNGVQKWVKGSTVNYCVQKGTFTPAMYSEMVTWMKEATKAWSDICNIKFLHREDLDGTPAAATPPAGATFTVRRAAANNAQGFFASAFFPGDVATARHLWLFPKFYASHEFSRVGILRHEVGHILGFIHEGASNDTPPACKKEQLGAGIPLTFFDSKSVMHHFCPFLGGQLGTRELELTATDIQGAKLAYPV